MAKVEQFLRRSGAKVEDFKKKSKPGERLKIEALA
jgi:hypothetical protein